MKHLTKQPNRAAFPNIAKMGRTWRRAGGTIERNPFVRGTWQYWSWTAGYIKEAQREEARRRAA